MNKVAGVLLAVIGAIALGGIALHRHEPINALWIVTAAVCVYALGYRFYGAWVAARVLAVDPSRATPAERYDNGRDFVGGKFRPRRRRCDPDWHPPIDREPDICRRYGGPHHEAPKLE